MYKRVISLIFALLVLAAIPLCAFAQGQEEYTDAGEVTIGTVVIDGEEYSFVYSPALTVNKSLASALAEKLGDCGDLFLQVKFDYEVLNRQGVFVICKEGGKPEYLAARPTLEKSFLSAFPEYTEAECGNVRFDDSLAQTDGVELDGDRYTAAIVLEVEPEYIEREVNGETYKVLMVGSKLMSYTVNNVEVELSIDPDELSEAESQQTDPVSEQTASVTSVATETTTTTATTTTAATTTTTAVTTTEKNTETTTTASTARASQEVELSETGYVVTNIMNLRVREKPSMEADVIAALQKGTQVNIIGAVGMEWYKIKLDDGRVGYCYAKYIEVK